MIRFPILFILLFLFGPAYNQTIFDSIAQSCPEPLELRITFDLKSFLKTVDEEPYYDANLALIRGIGDTVQMQANVRSRGNTRKELCYPPPIKIKFKKKDLVADGLDSTSNDYKLVLQCKSPNGYRQILYREYLAYRMYNLLTPASFKVHLLDIILIDENDPELTIRRDGFLLESEEQVAERMDGLIRERPLKYADPLEDEHFFRFCLFQYFIGNTDWALGNTHNLKMVERPKMGDVLLLPYDFDYSGLVNAPYAVPDKRLPIRSVRQRYYKGMHPTDEQLKKEVAYWQTKLPEIKDMIDEFEQLEDRSKNDINKYLASFEKILNNPKKMKRLTQ